jgi:alpha-glucoside transport system substrate-binding protein
MEASMRCGKSLRESERRVAIRVVRMVCVAVALAVSIAVAATVSRAQPTAQRGPGAQPPLPAASVAAAEKAARAIVHGKKIGGSADFLGVVTGSAGDALLAALKPFEDATGVKVDYEATFSQQSILQTRIQAGNPPDVVFSSYPLQLVQLARQGKLAPMSGIVDMRAVERQYPKALLDLGTVNGKLYAYFSIVNYHALIWYDPNKYTGPRHPSWAQLAAWTKQSAAAGKPPWCLGIESGATTGWPAANEVLDALFVRRYGPKLAAEWEAGKLPWTSPQVRWAWNSVGAIFTDPKMVNGGAAAVASTNFLAAGNGMFSDPPTCYLLPEEQWYGEFVPALVKGTTPADVGYFPFPSIAPAYKDLQMVDGNQVAVLRNRPQARALAAYMATPQFETLLAETGQFLVPNAAVSASSYPTPLARSFAKSLVASKTAQKNTILVPSVLFPVAVTNEFFKDLTTYLQNPGQLSSLLSDMDSVAKSSG